MCIFHGTSSFEIIMAIQKSFLNYISWITVTKRNASNWIIKSAEKKSEQQENEWEHTKDQT